MPEETIDEDEDPIRNATTGKLSLVRGGTPLETLCNTVVHELFHAFMDDYNRTGMLGAKSVQEGYTPDNKFANGAQEERYDTLHFPTWFMEGAASAMENVYQYRYEDFQKLREKTLGNFEDAFTRDTLLNNYQDLLSSYDLELSTGSVSGAAQGNYVTGYLAMLYLSELAAQKDPAIGSAKSSDGILIDVSFIYMRDCVVALSLSRQRRTLLKSVSRLCSTWLNTSSA